MTFAEVASRLAFIPKCLPAQSKAEVHAAIRDSLRFQRFWHFRFSEEAFRPTWINRWLRQQELAMRFTDVFFQHKHRRSPIPLGCGRIPREERSTNNCHKVAFRSAKDRIFAERNASMYLSNDHWELVRIHFPIGC